MARALSYTVVALLLASCVSTYDYPAEWAAVQPRDTSQTCPSIAGIYEEHGKVGRTYDYPTERSLAWALLATAWEQAQAPHKRQMSADMIMLTGGRVEISQPRSEVLELTFWQTRGGTEWVAVRRQAFSINNGDFSCSPNGIVLTRTMVVPALLLNTGAKVWRTLNTAADGSLVMKVEERSAGNFYMLPFANSDTYWVRWQRGVLDGSKAK